MEGMGSALSDTKLRKLFMHVLLEKQLHDNCDAVTIPECTEGGNLTALTADHAALHRRPEGSFQRASVASGLTYTLPRQLQRAVLS